MTESGKCCLCNGTYNHYGNNPFPFFPNDEEARCCKLCDNTKVLPVRLLMHRLAKEQFEGNTKTDIAKLFHIFNDEKMQAASLLETLEIIEAS